VRNQVIGAYDCDSYHNVVGMETAHIDSWNLTALRHNPPTPFLRLH